MTARRIQDICRNAPRTRATWPIAKPYDVIFYRSRGLKARLNVAFQHAFDPATFTATRKYTHCALVGSELTAVEAYPRAARGYYTELLHPGGVRFVPVIDLCYDSARRYQDFQVLRAPGLRSSETALGAEPIMNAWRYLKSRYGLRRLLGIGRNPAGRDALQIREWLSCSDLVLRILADSNRFGLKFRERVTPSGLLARLRGTGWRDVTADYAPHRCEMKNRQHI